ncbi:peptidoglycan/LPS O-acetylase OafA/YrhL [Azospirillum baldaniorum]|uniref:acyltransferase family protein n=1 Tax=Azospirillum baldaniorum TaxID=1064539 RepID=UPI0011A200F6|nr:acyltransferase family protein [Azospirillum baldaniorum]TWA69671.1 peptidoglycan/LPS O-acetylase OafA/YrhL [Azospirillum baldaniorum]
MTYRPDIDGLRAVSILSVLLFHAKFSLFSGGYIGVDVFFVISGYLIGSIVLNDAQRGRFSLADFYVRRIRRILPALFAALAVTTVLALFLLSPQELKSFAQNLAATTLFSSNIVYYLKSGYFENAAEMNPLLHTWSLGVEQQFYIVFPLAVLALIPYRRSVWVAVLLAAAAASFALGVSLVRDHPVAAFYLLPPRLWELVLGALLAFGAVPDSRSRAVRELACAVGAALILVSVFALSEATAFPGYAALLPCLGAALVIHAGRSGPTAVGRALTLRPMVFIGLISYSMYIWHWPLMVFARFYKGRDLSTKETLILLAAIAAVSVLSWRLIEVPFRKPRAASGAQSGVESDRQPAKVFARTGWAMAGLAGVGLIGHLSNGLPQRFADYAPQDISGRELYKEHTCFLETDQPPEAWSGLENCRIGSPKADAPTALLWGDSFAAHYVPGLQAVADTLPFNIVQYTASGCPPIKDLSVNARPNCQEFNRRVEELIDRNGIRIVIMAARWEWYMDTNALDLRRLHETVDALLNRGIRIVVLGQSPVFRFRNPYDHTYFMKSERAYSITGQAADQPVIAATQGARFIDTSDYFCDPDPCKALPLCRIRDDQGFYFLDQGHFSTHGSTLIVQSIQEILRAPDPSYGE